MPNQYIISTGHFIDSDNQLVAVCYAGHPPYVNDVAAIALKARGPLPPGPYMSAKPINTDPDRSKWYAPHAHLGPLAIPLVPLPIHAGSTGAFAWLYGRNGFYIHGDSIQHPGEASDGCIIPTHLPDGTENGHAARLAIAAVLAKDQIIMVRTAPDNGAAENTTPEAR